MPAWLLDLNPTAINLFGLPIRWYGLSYAVGFFLGWMFLRHLAKRGLARIPVERTADAAIAIALGAVVGGRLGYVLIYQPSLLWEVSAGVPWWGVLRINNGGMASHGGMIGAIVACWIVSRAYGEEKEGRPSTPIPFLHMLDLLCAIAPIGLLLGRIANFVNGELLGRIVTQPADGRAAPWWAVKYPQELLERNDEVVRTPAQELALDRLVEAHTMPGDPTQLAYDQMIRRVQRGDESLAEQLAPLISARHPSQLYQAFVEGVVLFVVLWVIWRKPRKPGVVGCWFLIVYGVGRIATEFWRLPDAHLAHERIMGMSRGQWLSAAMVGFGLVLLPILARRDSEKLGGWVSRKVVP